MPTPWPAGPTDEGDNGDKGAVSDDNKWICMRETDLLKVMEESDRSPEPTLPPATVTVSGSDVPAAAVNDGGDIDQCIDGEPANATVTGAASPEATATLPAAALPSTVAVQATEDGGGGRKQQPQQRKRQRKQQPSKALRTPMVRGGWHVTGKSVDGKRPKVRPLSDATGRRETVKGRSATAKPELLYPKQCDTSRGASACASGQARTVNRPRCC